MLVIISPATQPQKNVYSKSCWLLMSICHRCLAVAIPNGNKMLERINAATEAQMNHFGAGSNEGQSVTLGFAIIASGIITAKAIPKIPENGCAIPMCLKTHEKKRVIAMPTTIAIHCNAAPPQRRLNGNKKNLLSAAMLLWALLYISRQ